MEIIKLVTLGVSMSLIISFVSSNDKERGGIIRLAAVSLLFLLIVPQLGVVIELIQELWNKINLDNAYLVIVLKIIGVAYITEFGYQLCKDTGEESVATKLQLGGKIIVLVLAAPIILALVELVNQLL
ncbi:MAG: stage III sporulation protein AD [Cellulosilyticaceae bacterium]